MKKYLKILIISMLFLSCFAISLIATDKKREYKYKINDTHCHYVDFVQHTDGMEYLLKQMDSAGVENIVLFGISVTKLWTDFDRIRPIYYDANDAPVYYYAFTDVILAEAVKKLPKDQQKRIYPMICGFNPVDRNAIDHIRRMVEMYPDMWVGIGEVFFRHDDLTRMTYGRNPTANCISMNPVYKYAAEKNLPMWIHSDIGDPINNTPAFLYEMEETIKKHPKTKIVWCHIGNTRGVNVPNLPEITVRLLKTYPNLYYDLSWVVFDQIIAPDGKPDPTWVKIIEQYPNRFMIGTDKIGGFFDYKQTIRRYDVLLDQLKPETAKKVASENMFELVAKKK